MQPVSRALHTQNSEAVKSLPVLPSARCFLSAPGAAPATLSECGRSVGCHVPGSCRWVWWSRFVRAVACVPSADWVTFSRVSSHTVSSQPLGGTCPPPPFSSFPAFPGPVIQCVVLYLCRSKERCDFWAMFFAWSYSPLYFKGPVTRRTMGDVI